MEQRPAENGAVEQKASGRSDDAIRQGASSESGNAVMQEALDCGGKREREAWPLLSLATKRGHRARGLLCTDPHEDALLLMPCCDIHTVGMRYALDVAFVDHAGYVVEAHRSVGPLRRLRNMRAAAVLERFAACGPWFQPGDRVGLSCVRAEAEHAANPVEFSDAGEGKR